MSNVILSGEHVAILGANGTGKTILAKAYSANYPHVAILDIKGTFTYGKWRKDPIFLNKDDFVIVSSIDKLYTIDSKKISHIIYRPSIYENNLEYYERFLEWCYKRQNCIVLIDEAMGLCTAQKIPFWYHAILTRGREINVSAWSCSQRPSGLSNFVLTESKHWFVFRLNSADDREKLVKCSGDDVFKNKMTGHNFMYKNMDKDERPRTSVLNILGGN